MKAQQAGQRQWQRDQELTGHVHVSLVLTEVQQNRLKVPQDQRSNQRHAPCQPQAGLGQTGDPGVIIRALANRNQRADRRHDTDAEERHEVVARSAQPATGQGSRAQLAHHHGVGEHHQHVRHLRSNQRPGQTQDDPQFFESVLVHGLCARATGVGRLVIVGIAAQMHKAINPITRMSKTHPGISTVE